MADQRQLPAQVTMPLLARITQESLEEDYRHVAAGRTAGPADRPSRRWSVTVVAVMAFGLLVSVAAVQTSRTAPVRAASKEVLIGRIDDQQAVVAGLHREIATLTSQTTAGDARYSDLTRRLNQAEARERALAASTGFAPVSGPGVRVTVDDAPGATAENGGMVQDRDLRTLFDGLWAAGATAIAVNGQRVTALSAPRNTGPVIRINGVSLSPPYRVVALGDTKTLQARFADTTSGSRFTDVAGQLGMPVSTENVGHLDLPAAPAAMMHVSHARHLTSRKAQNAQEDAS